MYNIGRVRFQEQDQVIATDLQENKSRILSVIRPYVNQVNMRLDQLDERLCQQAAATFAKISPETHHSATHDNGSDGVNDLTVAQLRRACDSQFHDIECQMGRWLTSFTVIEGWIEELESSKHNNNQDNYNLHDSMKPEDSPGLKRLFTLEVALQQEKERNDALE